MSSLRQQLDDYLQTRRALGFKLATDGKLLASFVAYMDAASADTITVASGMKVALPLPVAVTIDLLPFADAKLPMAPERAPKQPSSFAGFISVPAPPQGGNYKVTLSSEAWIDVMQDGHFLKSTAHTGASGCAGIRKSVKFNLDAAPFVVQLSNVPANKIGVAITGD